MNVGVFKSIPQRPVAGFSLLAVMIALFVLSVAMIGIAGLQVTTSKRTNFEAVQRTTASLLAQELLERIRANDEQLTVYANGGLGRTIELAGSDGISATNCVSAACDTATLAMYDRYEFSRALAGISETAGGNATGGLAAPTVCITGPVASPGFVNVALAWRGMTALSNPGLNACGAASGRYDGDGVADAHRRVLLVETCIE